MVANNLTNSMPLISTQLISFETELKKKNKKIPPNCIQCSVQMTAWKILKSEYLFKMFLTVLQANNMESVLLNDWA